MYLVEHHLLQEVQPDIMSGRAFTKPRIMVLATEKLDVVIVLIKVEVQISAALGAFHHAGEHAGLLCNGSPSAARGMQTLHLFPCDAVNDRLIEKDCPVFLRVFEPPLYLVGLGIALEVDHVAAIFLQGEDFLDGGVVPFGMPKRPGANVWRLSAGWAWEPQGPRFRMCAKPMYSKVNRNGGLPQSGRCSS